MTIGRVMGAHRNCDVPVPRLYPTRHLNHDAAPMPWTFAPRFPEESIKRYPSLTRALGDSYPGVPSGPSPLALTPDGRNTSIFDGCSRTASSLWSNSIPIVLQDTALAQGRAGHSPDANRTRKRSSFTCGICGKSFNRSTALSAHLNVHYDTRPFMCAASNCQRAFRARANAVRHMRLAHSLSVPPSMIRPSAPSQTDPYVVNYAPTDPPTHVSVIWTSNDSPLVCQKMPSFSAEHWRKQLTR
ncbi:hypothetical protein DFH07DRAFT_5176 [Mycena maculata]|uniref:C2H2-type domain-containing protein n=1 Tax=Mycena maculata TaxID=230809 RepID=A0AAD7P2G4_9AGAR|nr:hypothetical protein DFH07DRAFT_5176 [Mycena maculata]